VTEINKISDEMLNAFIDHELSDDDMMQIYTAMSKDTGLRARVCDLRATRDLVRSAYPIPPLVGNAKRLPSRFPAWGMAAAVALLSVGGLLGWLAYPVWHAPAPSALVAGIDDASMSAVRVVFHASRNDANAFEQILDEAETLLAANTGGRAANQVRIVANGEGLYLLSARASPFKDRIQRLNAQHKNHVVFAGCAQTSKRMKRERGEDIELLPGVLMVNSGVIELLELQEKGWRYLPI
jgi:intracellular sulfur oxidation DsrE/DsrF family protein